MTRTVVHRSFASERRYGCTPREAFSAFADPQLKRRWFGSPDAVAELDFRVGGSERSSGDGPDGSSYAFEARYHDIVPGERIVFAYDLRLNGRLVSVSLTTVELLPDGTGTRLVFTEQGAFLDGLDDPDGREHGTGKLLDRLGELIEEQWPR
jgi:uncharacterized protein YndB with AHSA1/START domain